MSKTRGYVFTINNPNGWDDADLEKAKDASSYLVYGKEVGENGTPHYQGYIRFANPVTFKRVKALIPRAHIEVQKGTAAQAAEYCKKDGDFIEHGDAPISRSGHGMRTKLMWRQCIDWAESGELDKIKDEYPHIYVLHHTKLLGLRKRANGILPGSLQNEWWVGPTGTGKSRSLWELYPEHYPKQLNKWWDGYNDERVIAMEEMDPDHGRYLGHFIKTWADRYPFSPEVEGSTLRKIRPEKIIILSNYTIEECFERVQDREPIKRRFKVKHFHEFFNDLELE